MINPIHAWRSQKSENKFIAKTGRLINFTKINHPPLGFGNLPYYVGIVEFKDKTKKTGQLVIEGQKPKINAKVIGVLRKIGKQDKEGLINYTVKFKLL